MRLCGRLLALFLGLGPAMVSAQAQPSAPIAPEVVTAAIAAAKSQPPPAPYVLKGPSKPVTRNAPLDNRQFTVLTP